MLRYPLLYSNHPLRLANNLTNESRIFYTFRLDGETEMVFSF